jgi:intein/homing endonuclease
MIENLDQVSNKGKQIKVLVIPSDRSGVSKFRSIDPHLFLQSEYPIDFHVDINYEPPMDDMNFWKDYEIVAFHRSIGHDFEKAKNLILALNKMGIITVCDIDDYWMPTKDHPIHEIIKIHKINEKIIENLKAASYVTTTTRIYADLIRKYNKNVFVFPNAINPKESQFNEPTLESDRIRVGWLGGSCYDDTTEVLTENGFKLFKDLGKDEKVVTLNPINDEIEYHIPIHHIAEPFKGELNCVKSNLIEYAVTPNHKMYVSQIKNLTHKKLNFGLIESKDVYGTNFHTKRNGVWNGKEEKYFKLPAYISDNNFDMQPIIDLFEVGSENELFKEYNGLSGVGIYQNTKQTVKVLKSVKGNYYLTTYKSNSSKYGKELKFDMDDWLKFFGFWLAEGWTSKSKGLNQVGICQFKNNNYLSELYDVLVRMGFKPTFTKNGGQLRVFNKQLWKYLSQFGYAQDKFIPQELLNLSSRQLTILLDWYIKGDGHIEVNSYNRVRGFTSSKKLADNLQEIALKIGIAATITNRGKRGSSIKGRVIKSQHDNYTIGFSSHPYNSPHHKLTPLVRESDHYKKYYDGMVYCVEVQNHILYVRKNGKAFWCGNSHQHDLMILDKPFGSLTKYSNKLQFVLCGFDTRGSVTEINAETKQQKKRNIKPEETVWARYEEIFTQKYSTISYDYKKYLLKFVQEPYDKENDEAYVRAWTKPVTSYAKNYAKFDVSLAPIKNHIFNEMKSQLKVIEAGFYKKALIASNFGPYTIDLKHGLDRGTFIKGGNALLVDVDRNGVDWAKYIEKLMKNPNLVKDLGENLYETVKDTYSLITVTKNRAEFYKSIIK